MDELVITSISGAELSEPQPSQVTESQSPQITEIQQVNENQSSNNLTEERDRLLKILERRDLEIERLETELQTSKQQLTSAIDAKCSAIVKSEEANQKMLEIDFKEKRMELEKSLMESQIKMLTNDLNRNVQELQQLRMDSSTRIVTLEGKLHEKSEELNILTLQSSQLRESNETLTNKVKELSQNILTLNDEFSITMKKYQNELSAKTRLVELYKSKNEDTINQQKEITDAMAELKAALNEATEEYGKLETKAKADEVQHQLDVSALNSVIEELKTELRHANHLLNALKQENVQIAVEKICPSVSKNRHSISSVYSMYVNANEDYEQLSVEHEQLKHQFSRVVDEIKDKAPQIQRTQIELTKLKEENEEMQAFCDSLKIDRLVSQEKINGLLQEVTKLSQKVKELQQEKTLMSHQVCELLNSIEGKKNDENKKSDFSTFRNIEELQQNNVQLVNLVRELTASIEELEKKKDLKIDESQNLKSSKIESQSAKIDGQISKTENSMPNQQNESNLAQSYSDSLKEKIKIQQTQIESLNNQLTSLKTQLTEVQSLNFKLKSQLEHSDGQLKLQQKNFEMMKKKMQTVDEKNQNSMTTIAKLETTLVHLREQLRDTTMKLTKTENSLASINYENKTLVRSEAQNRAKIETQEKQSKINGHLITNLEFIRASIERIENSGSALKLKEKCEELEQQLEKEKNKLKDFESQANAEIEQLECETQLMQDEISKLKEICEKKSTEIEKLSEKIAKFKKIGESEQSDSSESDTEVARLKENVQKLRKVGKQYRQECFELRSQLEEAKVKNEELQNSKTKEESMRNLLTKAKSMITKLNEEKDQLKQKLKAENTEFLSCESQDLTLTDLNVSFARDEIPRTSTKKRARSDDGDDDDVIILECSEKKIKSEEIKEVGKIEIEEFYGCKYPMME